jgi:hypothetical protein
VCVEFVSASWFLIPSSLIHSLRFLFFSDSQTHLSDQRLSLLLLVTSSRSNCRGCVFLCSMMMNLRASANFVEPFGVCYEWFGFVYCFWNWWIFVLNLGRIWLVVEKSVIDLYEFGFDWGDSEKFGGLGFKVEDESSTMFLRIYGFDLFLGGERKEILFVVSWHENEWDLPLTVMTGLIYSWHMYGPGPMDCWHMALDCNWLDEWQTDTCTGLNKLLD